VLTATDLPELPEAARQKLSRALELTRLSRAELENAQLRLDTDAFATESEILVQYERILNQDLGMRTATTQNGEPDGDVSAVLPTLSTERSFEQHLASLTEEMVLGFAPDAQPTLAVAGFTAPGDARGALLDVLNNALTTSFAGLPQFTMVDRGSLERVLEEQELSLSGLMDTTTAVRVGNLLSAAYIVTGNLIETTESVIIFARIVNVETGTIESAAQTVVSKKSDITRFL
jgi:TolB-like protein